MKNAKILIVLFVAVMAACSKDSQVKETDSAKAIQPLSGALINQKIEQTIEKSGSFKWSDADDYLLWSACVNGDSMLTIGFGESPFNDSRAKSLSSQKSEIINLVQAIESNKSTTLKSASDLLLYEDQVLNYMDFKVGNIETISKLRTLKGIRYIEPSGYRFFAYQNRLKSSSGCTKDASTINSADYRAMAPNCLVSWTFDKHNIPAAWEYSTGSGVGVGLIDTGISDDQSLLGSSFNCGYSSGRTVTRYGVYVDSFWPWSTSTDGVNDKCGHGTLMGGTIASPRNDKNMPVGVAYNCNLVAYRATGDVVLDGYHEQNGVAKALTSLGNRSDIKVISMSIGHIISIGKIEDAVKYAYSKGKLIIAAGGTSFSWTNWVGVIFPASMAETVATTGITDGSGYTECEVCHKGSKIEFTVIMQRAGDSERTSVCPGYYNNTRDYVGGSSVSAATTAGIAALVWSRYPNWTREQVLNRMRQSASLYPNKSADFGYGSINVLAAVQ